MSICAESVGRVSISLETFWLVGYEIRIGRRAETLMFDNLIGHVILRTASRLSLRNPCYFLCRDVLLHVRQPTNTAYGCPDIYSITNVSAKNINQHLHSTDFDTLSICLII